MSKITKRSSWRERRQEKKRRGCRKTRKIKRGEEIRNRDRERREPKSVTNQWPRILAGSRRHITAQLTPKTSPSAPNIRFYTNGFGDEIVHLSWPLIEFLAGHSTEVSIIGQSRGRSIAHLEAVGASEYWNMLEYRSNRINITSRWIDINRITEKTHR